MNKTEILQDIRKKILDEEYHQGQSLIERELCEIYNISRSPIREILWSLVVDGIVEQQPSRGFLVKKLDSSYIFEIFQTREAVEGMAARIASMNTNSEHIRNIKQLYKELLLLSIEDDKKRGVSIGRILHKEIIKAANNSLLSGIYKKLSYLAALTSNISSKSILTEKDSKKYHLEIMEAILSEDAEKSEQSMRKHLQLTYQHIINMLYS
ncbi:MAG: GntR family transcriptional regulator [Spirochaetia bacterium]|nr:GntR family transcriptional regulator [Spirochaetia bacterium]MCF7945309.1 GntR family transcriptional regulator [Spirochaetia bacterium]MCF7946592.1 GntR family transcriptional regulator [Spirochaetia bacterium]